MRFVLMIALTLLATLTVADQSAVDIHGRPLFGADGSRISHIERDGQAIGLRRLHPDGSVTFEQASLPTPELTPEARPKSHSNFEFGAWEVIREYDSSESALKFFVTPSGKRRVAAITDFYFDDTHDYHLFVYEFNDSTNRWDEVRAGGWQYDTTYPGGNAITVVDMNKDFEPDIIVGHAGGITVFLATPLSLDYQILAAESTVGAVHVVLADDVDDDTYMDIISLPWSGEIVVSYGNGTGTFREHVRHGGRTHAGFNDMELGDVDNDGDIELIVMSGQLYAVPNITVYDLVPGLPLVSEHFVDPVGRRDLTYALAIGDFTGNGRSDIALSRPRNSPTWLYEFRQDSGGLLVEPPTQYPTYDIPESLETMAVDCVDTLADLVVAHGGWLSVGLYLQETGGLGSEMRFPVPYASHYDPDRGIDLGDGNGDGIVDLFVADYNNGFLFLPGQCTHGVSDTDGDTVPDTDDCAPTDPQFWAPPEEVRNLRARKVSQAIDTPIRLWWTDESSVSGPGTTYQVAGGTISLLWQNHGFEGATCPIPSAPSNTVDVSESGSWWYLVRAVACGMRGTYGSSFGSPTNYREYLEAIDPCP